MNISTNIANLIDKHTGLFVFASDQENEELLDVFLEDVISNISEKQLQEVKIETYEDLPKLNFSNKVFIFDISLLASPKPIVSLDNFKWRRQFCGDLHSFCSTNNNVAIVKTHLSKNTDVSGLSFTRINLTGIVYSANTAWVLSNNILKNVKNRYEMDGVKHNLLAFFRDKRIDDILSEE